jgi:hypothetical protein
LVIFFKPQVVAAIDDFGEVRSNSRFEIEENPDKFLPNAGIPAGAKARLYFQPFAARLKRLRKNSGFGAKLACSAFRG